MAYLHRLDPQPDTRLCLEGEPSVLHLRDHVHVPVGIEGCASGVYDVGRRLIHQSIYLRGPDPAEVYPGLVMPLPYDNIAGQGVDETYIYLGHLHRHFGHFLLSTLSRLWNIRDLPPHKIICTAEKTIDDEWARAHVATLFSTLGISRDRLVSFDAPMRIANLILPLPSFEERHFSYRAFARLCNALGQDIRPPSTAAADRRPVYLSKTKLKSGVRQIVNEEEICAHLERAGVEIIHPETLSFTDQVALWDRYAPVVSFSASALHMSVFNPNSKLICLSYGAEVDPSYPLCDKANGTDAQYFCLARGALKEIGPSGIFAGDMRDAAVGFSSRVRVSDPRAVAEAIVAAIRHEGFAPKGAVFGSPSAHGLGDGGLSPSAPDHAGGFWGRLAHGVRLGRRPRP